MVLATQNPIEYEGTFPLPEAQMDRFLLRISLGYPAPHDEVHMMERQQIVHPVDELTQVVDADELLQAQADVKKVSVTQEVKKYIVDIVTDTRSHREVYLGASPRGSLAMLRGAQAVAAMLGRDYVVPDDVKSIAMSALAHRVIVGSAARIREVDSREIVEEILEQIPVPGGEIA
jgi:MoxR-like ATPase